MNNIKHLTPHLNKWLEEQQEKSKQKSIERLRFFVSNDDLSEGCLEGYYRDLKSCWAHHSHAAVG